MRKIILFLLFLLAGSCVSAQTQFSDLKFSKYQFSDTQWNVSACLYTSTCQIYSLSGIGTTWNLGYPVSIGATQYIGFLPSGNGTYPWTMVLYNSDGSRAQNLGIGRLDVQGQDSAGHYFFFFTNSNLNGSVFSLDYGFANSNGFSFTGTNLPTVPQTNGMASNGSTTPLGSGQSLSSGPTVVSTSNSTTTTTSTSGSVTSTYSQPVTVTTYSDGSTRTTNNGSATLISTSDTGGGATLTANQQSDIMSFNNNAITNNGIYIRQTGNNDVITVSQIGNNNLIGGVNQQSALIQNGNNSISIKQGNNNGNTGKNEIDLSVVGGSNNVYIVQGSDPGGVSAGNNYQLVSVNGFSNSITTSQTNDGGAVGHFLEAVVNGNYNTVGITQDTNGQKQLFASITGNTNTVNTVQTGTGQHYLNVNVQGNGNSAIVNQSGAVANNASITLINSGSPASVNLTQTGGQSYSITQTCYTACGTVTVRQ